METRLTGTNVKMVCSTVEVNNQLFAVIECMFSMHSWAKDLSKNLCYVLRFTPIHHKDNKIKSTLFYRKTFKIPVFIELGF